MNLKKDKQRKIYSHLVNLMTDLPICKTAEDVDEMLKERAKLIHKELINE